MPESTTTPAPTTGPVTPPATETVAPTEVAPTTGPITPSITPSMSPEAIADALIGKSTEVVAPAATEVKTEVKPEEDSSSEEELTEATYTKDQVKAMMTKRVGQMKHDAIKAKADELAKQYREEADEAKKSASTLKRENEALKLSHSSGHSFELLYKTGLTGDALVEFVADLDREYSGGRRTVKTTASNSLAARLNKSVVEDTATNSTAWKATMAAALRGEK